MPWLGIWKTALRLHGGGEDTATKPRGDGGMAMVFFISSWASATRRMTTATADRDRPAA
jgi:hypothetical protein